MNFVKRSIYRFLWLPYATGGYDVNGKRYCSKFLRCIDYLKGVSIARQQINYLKPLFIKECEGDVVEIGGFDNYFKSIYTRGRFLNLDQVCNEHVDIVCNAEDMGIFADNSLGAFICVSVLEHTRNPELIVKGISRCLRHGGRAFISTPWLFEQHMEPQDYCRFSRYLMESYFEQASLKVLFYQPSNSFFGVVAHILQRIRPLCYSIGLLFFLVDLFAEADDTYSIQLHFIVAKQ